MGNCGNNEVMQTHFPLTIPSKPYLIKYLQSLYGNPIIFSSNNYFGTSLIGYVTTRIYLQNQSHFIRRQLDQLSEPLTFYLPRYWLFEYKYKTQLPQCNIIYLNKHIEEKFEDELTLYCFTLYSIGIERKSAIEGFCDRHNISIEDDISYEALKRKEYRCRKRMEINMGKTVPPEYGFRSDSVLQKNLLPAANW